MKKRGQVTIFVIIAIAIIGVLGVYFVLKTNVLNLGKEKINPQILPVYSFVENCIKTTGEKSIYHIGQTGGYFTSLNLSTDNKIAYYFYNNENLMPSKEKIEKELGDYLNENLPLCINDFQDFPDFNIKQEKIKTSVTIKDSYVVFDINYPLSIEKSGKTYSIKNFENIEIPSKLGLIYNLAYEIMQEQMYNKEAICFTCINRYAYERDLYAETNDYKDSIIFVLKDQPENGYKFFFANKY